MSAHRNHSPRIGRQPAEVRHQRLAWFVMVALGLGPTSLLAAAPAALAAPASATLDPAVDPGYVEFTGAFTGSGDGVDVSRFEKGNPVMPGRYSVDIYVNEGRIAREDVEFRAVEGSANARACFTYVGLQQMGVDVSKLDPAVVNVKNTCIAISDVSPDARVKMDMGELRLDVSIPQAALMSHARGYVSPDLWDQGETAFLLGYNANAYSSNQGAQGAQAGVNGYNDVNAYLGLNLGLNFDGWRLRSQESATWDQRSGKTHWNNIGTTATHDVTWLKAQFMLGDGYTQGVVFDSTPFRGISMYSDDRMLPDSQLGYAPVVRGMANTQARVEVRQSNNLLYETSVAPGPFVISDLYATGYGGDLVVTVFEADGSTHTFTVPYAAVPMLMRPGISRWSITDAQIRQQTLTDYKPYFLEGTYQRGINNWLTGYAGVQSTYRALYKAYLGGVAINTPVGALALDLTNSHTNFHEVPGTLSGYSARLTYSKSIPSTDTTFALASYRYSDSNFFSLTDAVTAQDQMLAAAAGNPAATSLLRTRQRLQLTVNQSLGPSYGSLYVTGSHNTYWNGSADATTYQVGYSSSYRRISYGITASRTYTTIPGVTGERYDNQLGINVSIPLGGPSMHTPMLTLGALHDDQFGSNDRAMVAGTFGDNSQYNYNGNASYASTGGSATTVSGGLGWRAPYSTLNASYSYASSYQQASVNAMGGVVIHPDGITFTPNLDLNSPIGVIEAPDATGAAVSSSGQGTVDSRGYAIATGLIPYRMNDVTLDPKGTSDDVELESTRLQLAPRAGAVVPLRFKTVSGRAVLLRAQQANGEPLPFGAQVLDAQGHDEGSVGQGGQVFVRGAEIGGMVTVRWGDLANQQCHIQYSLPARVKGAKAQTLTITNVVCR